MRPTFRRSSARRRRRFEATPLTGGATAIREVQALLRVLATGRDVAELGAAYGETAAIMAETARSVVTVELEPERVAVAQVRLRGLENVELLEGDACEQLRGRGTFGLVFADGGRPYDWEAILALAEPGGLIVKDDLTPGRPVDGDPVREFLLCDPRLAAAEIRVTPEMAVIVAARLR
jgi:predicted O-methyltransferase YrrM